MPQPLDEDFANDLNKEDRAYTEWERAKKNEILNMVDTQKKQERWNKLFIKTEPSLIPY